LHAACASRQGIDDVAIEFESELELSLAISANVLQLIGEQGVRVKDMPRFSGVSKEATAMSLRRLEERGLAEIKTEADGRRLRVATLTTRGQHFQEAHRELAGRIEKRWEASLDKKAVSTLRSLLERLVGGSTDTSSTLLDGLQAYPDGGRASLPKLEALPHYSAFPGLCDLWIRVLSISGYCRS
jgi:DNA-binding MarR family transcriptional regulator